MRVVAVIGLSGVGKTTLLRRLARRLPVRHLQASDLIKAEQARRRSHASTSEQLRTGPVLDNQALLVAGFRNAVGGYDGTVLFDGHALIDTGDQLIEIPEAVFADLGCEHIVAIVADPKEIVRRRATDVGRLRPIRSASQIGDQQRQSVEIAERIGIRLQVPCTVIRSEDVDLLEQLVRSIA